LGELDARRAGAGVVADCCRHLLLRLHLLLLVWLRVALMVLNIAG